MPRIGRPRKSPLKSDLDPRAQIIEAATGLFAQRGVAHVSMLEIAQRAGLGASSLYYWFRRKELLVAEILQSVNRLPLAYAQMLEAGDDAADVQLWRFVRFDVRMVCDFPLEITEIHRFAALDPEAFETYWAERAALTDAVARMVRRGVKAEIFRPVDAHLCGLTIVAGDESVQNWLRQGERRYPPDAIAELVADQTVGGLLARPLRLAKLKKQADAAE
jgi:TetR/AcrR family transcriptional regulator